MIEFHNQTEFNLSNQEAIQQWIIAEVTRTDNVVGELSYVFCDDSFLHGINVEYLNHDTLTDIISFDYTIGEQINGEIYISIERVRDNADEFKVNFDEELLRVIIHGVLHFLGYPDKTEEEKEAMRTKENEAIARFYTPKDPSD